MRLVKIQIYLSIPSLIRIFTDHILDSKNAKFLHLDNKVKSNCMDAQADLSICWVHKCQKVCFFTLCLHMGSAKMSPQLISDKRGYPQIGGLQIRGGFHIIFSLFLYKNICCGYSLEAPRWDASNEYPQHMFLWRNKKDIGIFRMETAPYLLLCNMWTATTQISLHIHTVW